MKILFLLFVLASLIIRINFINNSPAFGKIYNKNSSANNLLAEKYCDALKKNMFKGLDKESILKYEYFFSSIPEELIKEENKALEIFKSDVKSICEYEITKSNEEEFNSYLKIYFKTKSNTPKTKVEAINPTLTNPAIIPVLR